MCLGAPICGSFQAANLLWLVGLSRGVVEAFPGQDKGDGLGSYGSCSAEGNPVCSVASDKEGGECYPYPLCTQLVCQGKLLLWDAGTQKGGQASRSQEMRLKALLPGGNTWPGWGRRSPMCVHGSRCPGGAPGLRAAVPVLCRHLLCYSTCTQQLCLPWLWLPCSDCGSCASLPCCPLSQVHSKTGGGAPELLHSQPVPQCCIWAPSRSLKPLSLGENNKYFNQICQKHHLKGAKPTTVH